MKRLILTAFLLILSIPIQVNAGWFGPDNYEECILKNMKGVASDNAARDIRYACRKQFPKKTNSSRNMFADLIPKQPSREWFGSKLRIDIEDLRMKASVRKVEFVDFPEPNRYAHIDSPNRVSVRFMNRNSFAIDGVWVGVTGNSELNTCPSKLSTYNYILFCNANGSISANEAAKFHCDKWKGKFCVVGFRTGRSFQYVDEAEAFIKKHSK